MSHCNLESVPCSNSDVNQSPKAPYTRLMTLPDLESKSAEESTLGGLNKRTHMRDPAKMSKLSEKTWLGRQT